MKKVKYNEIMNVPKYSTNTISDASKDVLKKAWKVRNYEIDKYWSRTLYFVGFLSAILIAYITLKNSNDTYVNIFSCKVNSKTDSNELLYIILMGLGSFISFIWYLVNRGSKFWQENWEKHIDCLEKELDVSPLYGTLIFDEYKFYKKLGLSAYPISPSKANILISLVICICFLLTFIYEIGKVKLNMNLNLDFGLGMKISLSQNIVVLFVIVILFIFITKLLKTSCLKDLKNQDDNQKYIFGREQNNKKGLFELDDN